MKAGRTTLCGTLFVAIAVVALADAAAVRKEIVQEYAAYDKASLAGTKGLMKWIEKKLAPDFTIKMEGTTMNRKQFMDGMNQMAKSPDPMWDGIKSQKTTIDKLEVKGPLTVANVTVRGKYQTKDAKGKQQIMDMTNTFRETWTKVGGKWVVKASESTGGKMTVDGKPVGPGAK